MDDFQIRIEPLGEHHHRGDFNCGVPFIDSYFKKKSLDDHMRHKARIYVACINDSNTPVGFYTLSLTSLKGEDPRPAEAKAKFRNWAVPYVYLGQIGTCMTGRNRGVGITMMVNAFERTLAIADVAGTYGLMLDAIDDKVAEWYIKLGFQRFDVEADGRIKMHIPLGTIRQAINPASTNDNEVAEHRASQAAGALQ